MTKLRKRIMVLVLSFILTAPAFVCPGVINAKADGYLTGNIKITILNKGYGVDWLYALKEAYEEKYYGCTININEETVDSAVTGKLSSTANENDIIITTGALFSLQYDGYLLDLTDIYQTAQEGYDVPAIDRMNDSLKEFYATDDGKYYQIPWVTGYWGMAYNKTVIDDALGEGAWSFPNTTDELKAISAALNAEGVAPFILTTTQSYWSMFMVNMYYQYMGKEAYNNFYKGYYLKDGEYVAATDETFEEYLRSQKGVEKAASVAYELLSTSGFAHPDSTKVDFQTAQNMFCGRDNGSGIDSAFMVNGDFMFIESASIIDQTGDDVRMGKFPVLSSIVERLDKKDMTDEQLSKIISAIDAGATSYMGLGSKDFERIKDARFSSSASGTSHVIAIPKMKGGTVKYDLSKQFINFFLSREGQDIFNEASQGFFSPFYEPTESYSNFADSIIESMNDVKEFNVISAGLNSPLYYIAGLDPIVGYYEGKCLAEAASNRRDPQAYFNECVQNCYTKRGNILPLISGDGLIAYKHIDNFLLWMMIALAVVIGLLAAFKIFWDKKAKKLKTGEGLQ